MESFARTVRIVTQSTVSQLFQVVLVASCEILQAVATRACLFEDIVLECPVGFLNRVASLARGGWWMKTERRF